MNPDEGLMVPSVGVGLDVWCQNQVVLPEEKGHGRETLWVEVVERVDVLELGVLTLVPFPHENVVDLALLTVYDQVYSITRQLTSLPRLLRNQQMTWDQTIFFMLFYHLKDVTESFAGSGETCIG